MGAREWILVVIALLAVYLVFQLIRAMQAKDGAEPLAASKPLAVIRPESAAASEGADADDADDASEADTPARSYALQATAPFADAARSPRSVAEKAPEDFALALEIRQLRRDVSQLRELQDAQRSEISELRCVLDGQAAALAATRAAQSVSPMYSEALALAQRGMSADVIAERCSISVSEAELVQSLAREPDKGPEDTA